MDDSSSPSGEWAIDADLDNLDLDLDDVHPSVPLKKVPTGDIFEAARAGDLDRLRYLVESGVNINARDQWDSVALYYTCLAGHADAARLLLDNGAICSERTFDGDRCHYAALNLRIRRLLKAYEARPPPLEPLPAALRGAFLGCPANKAYLELRDGSGIPGYSSKDDVSDVSSYPPDVTFFVDGKAVEAHRVILSARSPFFKSKFETDWRGRSQIRFSGAKLSYPAFYSLLHFVYSDRLEVAIDDMEDLVRICKACQCRELQKIVQNELRHQQNAEYKAVTEVENSQKRFILQGLSLPEEDRLPSAMHHVLQSSLAHSSMEHTEASDTLEMQMTESNNSLADVHIKVGERIFHFHQVILASRSEYFKARLSHMVDFRDGKGRSPGETIPFLEEHDLSAEVFEKMIEYMYTDGLKEVNPDQAEEIFDAASRYLLFPLKRAVADAILPHLELLSPAELCNWLILSDMYGVLKIREYCLDVMACNFETFADTSEFQTMLLTLPLPSGDSSLRTTNPSAPGVRVISDQGNLLDDLREKWLEAEAAELDKRDESAALFDKRLEMLMLVAEKETKNVQANGE